VLRATIAAEREGIPAAAIIATQFLPFARAVAKSLGAANPVIVEYPGAPMNDSDEQLRDKVANVLVPKILEGWSQRNSAGAQIKAAPEPAPREIIFRGSLQQVQDHFYDRLWTDGLPVMPPTLALIEEFLRYTDRSPDEVIGVCPPECREATIWNIAVNGAMAGCRPEYLPVLIALVEAILEPEFLLEDAGATPGWEPLIVISGPIIKDLDFNFGGGVMRVGRRANSSIGRFLRMYMRNIAGQRIPPGTTDKATTGMTFNVVMAENEDFVDELGWPTFGVDHGYARDENVVTVRSCVSISHPTFSAGKDPQNHARVMAEVVGQMYAYWSYTGVRHTKWYPLILISPSLAKVFADGGWTKDHIRRHLYDHVRIPAAKMESYAHNSSTPYYSLKEFVAQGKVLPEYHASDDPNRLVRVFPKAEWIDIVVAGDPGRNQSRGYVQSHRQGVPVSKRIRLPDHWHQSLGRAKS
jgi:hypothetical protein